MALPSALANSPILPGADCRGCTSLWIPWGLSGRQILTRAPGFSSYIRPFLYGGMYTDVSGRKMFRRHRGLVPSSLLQETFTPRPRPPQFFMNQLNVSSTMVLCRELHQRLLPVGSTQISAPPIYTGIMLSDTLTFSSQFSVSSGSVFSSPSSFSTGSSPGPGRHLFPCSFIIFQSETLTFAVCYDTGLF